MAHDAGRALREAALSPSATEPVPVSSHSGNDQPRKVIHMHNGRAARHRHVMGAGETWCGKKLLGTPECDGEGIETFTSYGSEIHTTWDKPFVTCQACLDAFEASYRRAFPDGPKPIATFRLDNPDDVARAKALLSPEALNGFFGPGGGGMAAFDAALRDSDASLAEDAQRLSPEGVAARAEGIAKTSPEPLPNPLDPETRG
jgi:hypothetical protein